MEEASEEPPTGCRRHPFMALPLELRLLVWEAFGAVPRVFEYREDTHLVQPARDRRHARHVGLGVCAESRAAVRALLRPFPHPLDVQKGAVPSGPSPPTYVPASDIVYLPPLVYRSRLGAWDSPWTTKPGFRNVGLHWSVLQDERRIAEALRACAGCFTDMERLFVFVEFRPLPRPEEETGDGGVLRLLGPAEDEFRLPQLFSEAHGLVDDFWTWGELRVAIERVRRGVKGMPEVEGVLYCREVEDVLDC
ncbi:uncharacterized protein LY79DRAFT_670588 [Colletotrichum navitas]|uniref:2EXR domain-containing protein n=1 Tax=Colletotrichum navitas TaxID=681940 RepID=A0AAD8V285_9PEZI|nr:uncharacterized protein LY79DRAFT_670588 [Colletotrichum navitas]KAK1586161.1 hypothetical protein LY79DRAFT_670588 [Colletotrichum navitas]